MDHLNSTGECCDYLPCASQIQCDKDVLRSLSKSIGGQLWQVNALLVVNVILTAAIVMIGAYSQRFRRHPFTRLVYLGATTLFLPVISDVVSTITTLNSYIIGQETPWELEGLVASCQFYEGHQLLVIIWAFLVHVAVINTSVIVATDDREGHNIGPPFELLVQVVWTFYLGISTAQVNKTIGIVDMFTIYLFAYGLPFAFPGAKMVFKYYAFNKARQSIALGRNPRLISGYMRQLQLQEASQPHPSLPPLLVMGEEGRIVEKQPHGYVFKQDDSRTNNTNLVTIDITWQQLDNMLPLSSLHLKDLCLSFAFFKLLRCRFAQYEPSSVVSIATLNFFWNLLLDDGGHTRVFRVVADELSFLHDYYYTSLPVSYSKGWLPILSVCISFLSIGYCIGGVVVFAYLWRDLGLYEYQNQCYSWCISEKLVSTNKYYQEFGIMTFDMVPVYLLIILVVISEVRDISSYVCSNWTKVALICRYISRPSFPRLSGLLLNCSCKLLKHWDEKIGQCSALTMPHQRTSLFVLLRRLLHLPERKLKVKVSPAVKVCIIDALRRCNSSGRRLSNSASSLRQIHQAGESLLWACNGKGTSDIILAWHIATCILELRYPMHLMATYPVLLPDDDTWSTSLYMGVKKDAARVLAGCHVLVAGSLSTVQLEAEVQKLVTVLDGESKHEVLKNGARLGRQLVEMIEDEETKWKLVAGFWSDMILYVAPSNNLKAHSEALARGGELITLLWAMLMHAGIVSSSHGGTGGTTASASGDTHTPV